jgi:integrase
LRTEGFDELQVSLSPEESFAILERIKDPLAALLQGWRHETPYSKDSDFLFPSFKLNGKQPRLGSMIVQDYIRPAAVAAGVIPEDCPRFGFHNLRHGLSTFLIDNGQDPVVVQRMLRQSHVDMRMHYVYNSHRRGRLKLNSSCVSCRAGPR